jgi:Skp family chaperone for outer membrane proteins
MTEPMRSSHVICAACALVFACTGVAAADSPEAKASEFRIGVVNLKEIFDNYQKQKDLYTELHQKKDEMQKPIDLLSAEIQKDKERYDKEKDSMGEAQRRTLEEKIESNFTKYKAEFERAQQDLNRQEKKFVADVFEEIYIAVQKVGAQGNYHLVFESGESAAPASGRIGGLIYHSTTLNMTQKVVEYLNAEYKKK